MSPSDTWREALGSLELGRGPILVVVESPDGSIGDVLDALAPTGPVARTVAAEASRAMAGNIADRLGLGANPTEGVFVVEEAQWVDASSLGRLGRLIGDPAARLVLVLGRRPGQGWAIDRLVDTARRHRRLLEISIEAEPLPAPSDAAARDLLAAAGLVGQPLSVAVAAQVLAMSEDDTLALAESLVSDGYLTEARGGFLCARPVAVGEARRGHVARRLADVLEGSGSRPEVIGLLRMAAGDPAGAYPHLRAAAFFAAERAAMGEAHELAGAALEASAAISAGAHEVGHLHLIRGRHLRAAGRSDEAAAELEAAVSLLEGEARVDALGFAAAVADDRQRPQEAERLLAVAEWEAARLGAIAKLGSLSTFRARALNRLGFADECDALVEKGMQLLAAGEATANQRANGENNRAWIAFDRGQAVEAEMQFTHLRDTTPSDDVAGRADKEAWRARALFASGHPDAARSAVEEARRLADLAQVEAPLFLAELALAEGGLAYGRLGEAEAAAERALDLVELQLPAWRNVVLSLLASIRSKRGETSAAKEALEAAVAATPPGADGWRLRSRCAAIGMELEAAEGRFRHRDAIDLADALLQARLYGWAAELMCVIAEQRRDSRIAREAMALAVNIGNPMLAARAAEAGRLWHAAEAAPAIRAIRALVSRVPEDWQEDWRRQPGITAALEALEPAPDAGIEESRRVLEEALERAGLAADTVLSPAQRRRRGLVGPPRRLSIAQMIAAGLGVVVLAVGASVAVSRLTPTPPPVTIVREVAVTQPAEASLEDLRLEPPPEIIGSAPYRGGATRTGVLDTAGPRSVDGFFWTYTTAGPIESTPVAYGRNVYVASTDGTLYALDQTTGNQVWTMRTDGRITTTPEIASADVGEGVTSALVVLAGDDGIVRARDALSDLQSEAWAVRLGSRITSSPVVAEGKAFVATSDGSVHALELVDGQEVWRYPAEGDGLGVVSAPLVYHDGVVYVGTEGGELHLIEAATGEARCQFDAGAAIVANPVIADALYLPTRGNTIFVRPIGECGQRPVPGRLPLYGTETAVEVAPAIRGDRMYLPSGRFLYSIDLRDNSHAWPASTVDAGSLISGAPVVAGDAVYFGTEDGLAIAVDAETGDELWRWQTGNFVRSSPAVVEGAVFVASGDGTLYALGEE